MNTTAKWILTFALLVPAAALCTPSTALAGGLDCLGCSLCPQCDNCCTLKVDKVDADQYCWQVECEQICIPKIVFPWQKPDCCNPCVHNGARVKTIKVLKKHTYTCAECEYTWTPRRVGCCGSCSHGKHARGKHRHGHHHGGCASDCCDVPMAIDMGPSIPVPPVVPAPASNQQWDAQPYDQPVHSDPAPPAVEGAPVEEAPVEEAPTASLLQIKRVQAAGFFRDLLK